MQHATASDTSEPTNAHVVVLVLDGVRHQEVFRGVDPQLAEQHHLPLERRVDGPRLMPRLHGLMTEQGAVLGKPGVGEPIRASGPELVSLPGYSEVLTGSTASGCADNACTSTRRPSLADELAGKWSSAIVTSWPDIERIAARDERVAVSTGRHAGKTRHLFELEPATRAALRRAQDERPWPGHGDFRRDRFTAELALNYLDEHGPGLLLVSLGEPDEFAHAGDYAGYLDSLREADTVIGRLFDALEERARRGAGTALFVTADHGRAHNFRDHGRPHPESAQVWLVAAGSSIRARGAVAAPRERRLADIAPTIRELLGVAPDTSAHAGRPLTELLLPQAL